MSEAKRFWDEQAERYDEHSMKKYEQAYKETIALSKDYLEPGDEVLDYACGTGLITLNLAGDVKNMLAVDFSQKMVEMAAAKAEADGVHNIEFAVMDLYDGTLSGKTFDVVMAFNILYFLEDAKRAVERIRQLLKPGGLFLSATDCLGESDSVWQKIETARAKNKLLPYMRPFTREELKRLMEEGDFEILRFENLHPSPPNIFIAARKSSQKT